MHRVPVMFLTLVMLCGASIVSAADTYTVDVVHTHVGFTVRHLMINKVRGKFGKFSGTITYDEHDLTKSGMRGTIEVASIDTDHAKRDADLRSPNFFDAARYPTITFASTGVEKHGEGYVLIGQLTMRDTTKEIRLPFAITGKIQDPWGKTRIGFEASFRINRQEFGVSYSKTMDNGGLIVGNTVHITFAGEAVKQSS